MIIKPFPNDDKTLLTEKEMERINQELEKSVQLEKDMRSNGIDPYAGTSESFDAATTLQPGMPYDESPIIEPEYDQEKVSGKR